MSKGRGIIVGRKAPAQQLCERCGRQRQLHTRGLYSCPVPDAVMSALRTFAAANGKTWKSKLIALWTRGNAVDAELQMARNMIGPTRLHKIKLYEVRHRDRLPHPQAGEEGGAG